jgi:hypothetical protein
VTGLADRLTDTAAGSWGEEASIWLLDIHDHWLPELERCGMIRTDADLPDYSAINWSLAASAVLTRGDNPLIGTTSEWQILAVACSLTGRHALGWGDLSFVDGPNKRLVVHATAWASGGRAFADQLHVLATQLWVADYDGAEITVWSTADKAREYCDDIAKVDRTPDTHWDWVPAEEGGEQMVWVRELDDAPLAAGPGRITPITIDPAN